MDRNLQNKVIVITGGAGGIGSAIADMFLQKGAKNVVLLDIDEEKLKAINEKLSSKYGVNKTAYFHCDLMCDLEKIFKHILDTFNTVDVLVNSAGVFVDDNLKKIIDINVSAVIEWSTKIYAYMSLDKGGKGGTIINVSSMAGYRINPNFPVYFASKQAVIGFTRCFGHVDNYKKSGVRVVTICPGFTYTDMISPNNTKLDDKAKKAVDDLIKEVGCQPAEVVAEAAAQVFEIAESGSAWEIKDSKPVVEVLFNVEYPSK